MCNCVMATQNASWVLMFSASRPFTSEGRACGARDSCKRYMHIWRCMSIDYAIKTHTINWQCQNRGTLRAHQSSDSKMTPQNDMQIKITSQKRGEQTQTNAKKIHFRSRVSIMGYYKCRSMAEDVHTWCLVRTGTVKVPNTGLWPKNMVWYSPCPQDAYLPC